MEKLYDYEMLFEFVDKKVREVRDFPPSVAEWEIMNRLNNGEDLIDLDFELNKKMKEFQIKNILKSEERERFEKITIQYYLIKCLKFESMVAQNLFKFALFFLLYSVGIFLCLINPELPFVLIVCGLMLAGMIPFNVLYVKMYAANKAVKFIFHCIASYRETKISSPIDAEYATIISEDEEKIF